MDQPLLVRVVQGLGDRRSQFRRFGVGEGGLLHSAAKARAVDVLRDEEARELRRAADIVDRHNVLVVQVRQHPGFVQVRFDIGRLRCQFPVRHLDGDLPPQLIVVRQVDQPRPAFSQQTFDAVTPDVRRAGRLLRLRVVRLRSGGVCRLSGTIFR